MHFYEKQAALDEIGIDTTNKNAREIRELYQNHIGLLDKHDAHKALIDGLKVQHKSWKPHEYIYMEKLQVHSEDGLKINLSILNCHYDGWKIKND